MPLRNSRLASISSISLRVELQRHDNRPIPARRSRRPSWRFYRRSAVDLKTGKQFVLYLETPCGFPVSVVIVIPSPLMRRRSRRRRRFDTSRSDDLAVTPLFDLECGELSPL
jgi:hypothetical protein